MKHSSRRIVLVAVLAGGLGGLAALTSRTAAGQPPAAKGSEGGAAPAQGRIATVDFQRVLTNYYQTVRAVATLEDRKNELEKNGKSLADDLDKAKKEYQKLQDAASDLAISPEERDKRRKAADAKLKDQKDLEDTLLQYSRQANTTLREMRVRMRDRIYGDIRDAINAKAKAGGYALVIDTSAKSGTPLVELITMALNRLDPTEEAAKALPVVLYASGENDLTDELLKQLNAGAPLETSKPDEKKK